jgi:hypothetical protein
MKIKAIILGAALAAFFSTIGQATVPPPSLMPYAEIIPMRVLCVNGGPEPLLLRLMNTFSEVPKYSMEVSVGAPHQIGLIIAENKNNPSSTIVLVNPNLNDGLGKSCIFFTSKDYLKDNGAQSLEKKVPTEGETDA